MIESIGYGKFNYLLLLVCGMGWMADSTEMAVMAFLLPQIKYQFKLDNFQVGLLGSMLFVGMWLGNWSFGLLADRYGRRLAHILSLIVGCLAALSSAASSNFYLFLVFRILLGVGIGGAHTAFGLFAEFLPHRKRNANLLYVQLFWPLGSIFGVGLVWAILPSLGWRWLVVFSQIPMLGCFVVYYWLPESPRFLIMRNRPRKVVEILKYGAQMNGINRSASVDLSSLLERSSPPSSSSPSSSPSSSSSSPSPSPPSRLSRMSLVWRQIISSRGHLLFFALCCVWFLNCFIYYGLILLTPKLFSSSQVDSGSPAVETNRGPDVSVYEYLTLFLTALAELPGALFVLWSTDRLGHVRTQCIALCVCACTTACGTIISAINTAMKIDNNLSFHIPQTVFSMFSRAGIFASYSALYIYTPEVYPTRIRSTLLGVCNSFSRMAGIMTPFLANNIESRWIPLLVYTLCSVIAWFLVGFLLPESNHMHEEIHEPIKKEETSRQDDSRDSLELVELPG
jgi:MFS family permease